MNTLKLGFIGVGNMASAILKGVLSRNYLPCQQIFLANRHVEKLDFFRDKGIFVTQDNCEVAKQADVLVLAIKPQMFADVLPQIRDQVAGKCVVSIAAGISCEALSKALPGAVVMRAMPNTPLMVGAGATAVARAPQVPPELFQFVTDLFATAGVVALIEESQMDDIINVNGSSPAWLFRLAEVMVARAISVGIDEDAALRLTAKTIEGAGRLLLESGEQPSTLRKQVCSPGGTTLASLTAFDELGFEALMLEAMARCTARSKELGQ